MSPCGIRRRWRAFAAVSAELLHASGSANFLSRSLRRQQSVRSNLVLGYEPLDRRPSHAPRRRAVNDDAINISLDL